MIYYIKKCGNNVAAISYNPFKVHYIRHSRSKSAISDFDIIGKFDAELDKEITLNTLKTEYPELFI